MANYSYDIIMIPHVTQRTFAGETGSPAFGRDRTPARSLLCILQYRLLVRLVRPVRPVRMFQIHRCHITVILPHNICPFLSFLLRLDEAATPIAILPIYTLYMGFPNCNFCLVSSLLAPYTVIVACCRNSHHPRREELLKIDW